MSQIFGPPPPLGPQFDDNVAGRIKAKRLRRRAGAVGAATLVIALTGATIAVATSGNAQHETLLRTASSPTSQVESAPLSTQPATTTTTASTILTTPSTTIPPISTPATTPVPTTPPATAPPATTSTTTLPSPMVNGCPTGAVSLTAVVHSIRKGTDANGTPTWFVTATGSITNPTARAVDVTVGVWVTGALDPVEGHELALDSTFTPENPLTVNAGETQNFPLNGYEPLAADGSNAVAATQPDSIDTGGLQRRWHDLTLQSSCPVPGQTATFPLGQGTGGGTPGWPGTSG